ncbi:MAG: metal/formaldehyde-sensitive transcriptional repressor [Acidobacteriaceae bacterium]|jgi:DNA-binding FrmR family transcriptional regulator
MTHDEREKQKLQQRLKKVRGQFEAVERVLGEDEKCADVLMLLAAVRGGINGLMAEVLEDHIRLHLADKDGKGVAPELAEDLVELVRSYLK